MRNGFSNWSKRRFYTSPSYKNPQDDIPPIIKIYATIGIITAPIPGFAYGFAEYRNTSCHMEGSTSERMITPASNFVTITYAHFILWPILFPCFLLDVYRAYNGDDRIGIM